MKLWRESPWISENLLFFNPGKPQPHEERLHVFFDFEMTDFEHVLFKTDPESTKSNREN